MKLKLEQLIASADALERLAALYLTGALNFRNAHTLEDARKQIQHFNAARLLAFQTYGTQTGSDTWTILGAEPTRLQQFNEEIASLMQEEVEIYGAHYELRIDLFDASRLSGADMLALRWLVTFKEDEPQAAPIEEAKAQGA